MMNHSRLVTAFATLAALATVAPATAQEVHLLARVPFGFTVGDANLPGDTYRLTRMNGHPDMLFLRGDRTVLSCKRTKYVCLATARRHLWCSTVTAIVFPAGNPLGGACTRFEVSETKAERDAAEGRRHRAAALMETVIVTADRR